MQDIDFDELDKAVNSLMGSADAPTSTPKTTPTSSGGASISIPTRSSTTSSPAPSQTTPVVSSTPASPRPTAAPAVRRSGRFMDVVDPSSDLNPLRKAATTPSREGTSIARPTAPVKPVITSPTPSPEPVSEPKPKAAETPSEPVVVRRVAKDAIMPDPLDLLQPTEEGKTEPENQPASSDASSSIFSEAMAAEIEGTSTEEPKMSPELGTTIDAGVMPDPLDSEAKTDTNTEENSAQPEAPSESPFLSDAKIEKRPLNANPTAMSSTEPLVSLDDLLKDDQLAASDPEPETDAGADEPPLTPQIPELSSELIAIEATGRGIEEEPEDSTPPEAPAPKEEKTPEPKAEEATGPTSIAQQYKPAESTGDKSHAPIYDAEQYPDPVAHPAKKKSGWLWVLSVLILLALGSGGAVALYMMGIIP